MSFRKHDIQMLLQPVNPAYIVYISMTRWSVYDRKLLLRCIVANKKYLGMLRLLNMQATLKKHANKQYLGMLRFLKLI